MADGFRLCINFAETGRAVWLSHLELARAMERIVRRAGLPYASTQGFSPHMRISFGPALPVGVGGDDEYVELVLTDYVNPDEVLARLVACAPRDIVPKSVCYLSKDDPALNVRYTLYTYEACIADASSVRVAAAFDALVARGYMEVIRKKKPKKIFFDELLADPPMVESEGEDGSVRVRFAVRCTENGAIRPDLFCREALAEVNGAEIVSLTRTSLCEEQ